MPTRPARYHALALLIALSSAACSGEPSSSVPEAASSTATAAPTELELGDSTIVLGVFAWQDALPGLDDTGTRQDGPCDTLCVNGTVEARGGEVPRDLVVVDVLALFDGQQAGFRERELRGFLGPSQYEFWVGGGPPLVPGTTFDLAVEIEVDGVSRWLRARDVPVERTE